jgi:glycosyltransferase involved in cell wall biosynthesis
MKSLRVLHASPTWFSADSIVGGGERWVDNVMRAISVGAPWIDQTMVAIGAEPSLALRGKFAVRVLANERESRAPMDAISSRLWDEFASFDVIHIHQTLTDFGAYACCIAASLRKTIVVTDLGGGNNPVMVNGGLALADGVLSISNYAHARIASDVRSHSLVIIGPIDTDAFHPADRPPPDPAAICVGRIMPHKGIDRLIRALPTGLKLRVVGRVYHEPYRRVRVRSILSACTPSTRRSAHPAVRVMIGTAPHAAASTGAKPKRSRFCVGNTKASYCGRRAIISCCVRGPWNLTCVVAPHCAARETQGSAVPKP